jgi:hypothetical protein
MKKLTIMTTVVIALAVGAMMVFAKAKTDYVTANNQSSYFTGYVHVHCDDQSTTHINCTGSGDFYGNISGAATYCTINGYSTSAGNIGWAIDPHNDTLKVDFSQTNKIIVTDQSIVQ